MTSYYLNNDVYLNLLRCCLGRFVEEFIVGIKAPPSAIKYPKYRLR